MAFLILKGALVPLAIKLSALLPSLWMRAMAWFAVGAAFAAVPPHLTSVRRALVAIASCAVTTMLLLIALP
jgi:hypothetical protein